MSTPPAIVAIALSEVGYHEGRTGSVWNNEQKYSPAVPGLEWSQRQAWCATFCSWCALKAGVADYYPCTASTDFGATWFKDRGQWSQTPVVGALFYLGEGGDMYHVGLVIGVTPTHIETVEGNTNADGSAQGDGVYRRTRPRKGGNIEGYGIPRVPEPVQPQPKPTPTRGEHVEEALRHLRAASIRGNGFRARMIRGARKRLERIEKRLPGRK